MGKKKKETKISAAAAAAAIIEVEILQTNTQTHRAESFTNRSPFSCLCVHSASFLSFYLISMTFSGKQANKFSDKFTLIFSFRYSTFNIVIICVRIIDTIVLCLYSLSLQLTYLNNLVWLFSISCINSLSYSLKPANDIKRALPYKLLYFDSLKFFCKSWTCTTQYTRVDHKFWNIFISACLQNVYHMTKAVQVMKGCIVVVGVLTCPSMIWKPHRWTCNIV